MAVSESTTQQANPGKLKSHYLTVSTAPGSQGDGDPTGCPVGVEHIANSGVQAIALFDARGSGARRLYALQG